MAQQFGQSQHQWLIVSVVQAVVEGLEGVSRQLEKGNWNIVDLNSPNNPFKQPVIEEVSVEIEKPILLSIYSGQLL